MSNLPIQIVATDRDLTRDEARELTNEIKNRVAEIEYLLVRAYQGRAWLALGWASWDDYIGGEFKAAPLALPREQRRVASQSLAAWGLSTRAIAPAVGASQRQAARDVSQNGSPDSAGPQVPTQGLDGKTYPRKQRTGPDTRPDPAPLPTPATTACPTCGGTGKVTQ